MSSQASSVPSSPITTSSQASSSPPSSPIEYPPTVLTIPTFLPFYMSRPDLECFCIHQGHIIDAHTTTINTLEQELNRVRIFDAHNHVSFQELSVLLMQRDAELAEAQRIAKAQQQVIASCRENFKQLGDIAAERDVLIEELSARIDELSMQPEAAMQPDWEGELEEEEPVSPLQLPSPALSASVSSISTHRASDGLPAFIDETLQFSYSPMYDTTMESPLVDSGESSGSSSFAGFPGGSLDVKDEVKGARIKKMLEWGLKQVAR